jgi:hypothetical protein
MPTGEPMTITLPPELSDRVRAKMAENGYADALEVVEDGLLAERASPSGCAKKLFLTAPRSTAIRRSCARWLKSTRCSKLSFNERSKLNEALYGHLL